MSLDSKNRIAQRITQLSSHSHSRSHGLTLFSQSGFALLLFAFLVVHWVLAAILPLSEDEIYYWAWSQDMQWSYYDHPPMVAILIKLSSIVFGNTALGIRFFSPVIFTVIFALIASIMPTKKILILTFFTPFALFGSILMTPDVPLVLFWTLYLFWLIDLSSSFSQWGDDPVARVYRPSPVQAKQWIVGGLILGLGLLSKYSMVLAVPSSFLVLIPSYRMRSWIKGYCLHLLVAGVVALPIFIFNWKYHFSPLLFQWQHSFTDRSGVLGEFLGGQVALVGALPLLMLPWVLGRSQDLCRDATLRACYICFVFPFLFCLVQAMQTHVEVNWALMSYVAFWPLAQFLLSRNTIHWVESFFLGLGYIPPILISVLALIHLIHPLKWLPPEKDRVAKFESQHQLAKRVKQDLLANHRKETLYLPTYQWTAQFRFLGWDAEQLFPPGRASQFTLDLKDPCQQLNGNALLVLADTAEPSYDSLKCFPSKQLLREYELSVRKQTVGKFYLIEYRRSVE